MTAYSPLGSPHTHRYFKRGEDVPLLMQVRSRGPWGMHRATHMLPQASDQPACGSLPATLPAPPASRGADIPGVACCALPCARLQDETLKRVAEKHQRSPADILVRWGAPWCVLSVHTLYTTIPTARVPSSRNH